MPSDKSRVVIIDEPEIHLHRSIMNRLWEAIEEERKDCFFIYITHDTQFAAMHKACQKFWVKEFDGNTWKIEKIQNSELPEQLLLDILGNRKPVLFVEGTQNSYDTKLYSEIYKSYYIVPCGSCTAVIARTKAMNNSPQLHNFKCYGIIDRDYRTEYEINSYEKDNIYALKVAEVENLFLVEELLEEINRILGFSDNGCIEKIKNYIINDRFKCGINKQICEAVVAELKYKLTTAEISSKNDQEAKTTLNTLFQTINYDEIKEEQFKKFNKILEFGDYKEILKVFNCKSLSTSIGYFFGLDNKGYRDFVLRQLNGDKANEIVAVISDYLPEEIPQM